MHASPTRIVHYLNDPLPVSAIITADGMTYAVRNVIEDGYQLWIGPEGVAAPIVFATDAEAQRWIDDLASDMPNGVYRINVIDPVELVMRLPIVPMPSHVWTRKGDSYGYVPVLDLMHAASKKETMTTTNDPIVAILDQTQLTPLERQIIQNGKYEPAEAIKQIRAMMKAFGRPIPLICQQNVDDK